jgi:hypothetical protein
VNVEMVRQPGHGNVSGVLWCGAGDGFSFTLGRLHRGRRIIVVVCQAGSGGGLA